MGYCSPVATAQASSFCCLLKPACQTPTTPSQTARTAWTRPKISQVEEVRATHGKRVRELEGRLAETTRRGIGNKHTPKQSPQTQTQTRRQQPSPKHGSGAGDGGGGSSAQPADAAESADEAMDEEASEPRGEGGVMEDACSASPPRGGSHAAKGSAPSLHAATPAFLQMSDADVFAAFAVAGSSTAALDRIGAIAESLLAEVDDAERTADRAVATADEATADNACGRGCGNGDDSGSGRHVPSEMAVLQQRLQSLEQSQRDRYLEVPTPRHLAACASLLASTSSVPCSQRLKAASSKGQ